MCPCPVCLTITLLLAPILGYKWARKKLHKHHCDCATCQQAERRLAPQKIKRG